MNAFNRIVMLVIALLLVAVPALVLLAAFGVIPSRAASAVVSPLGSVPGAVSGAGGGASALTVVVSFVAGLVVLFLIFRELTPRPRTAKHVYLQNASRMETRLSASATKGLVGGAAREAGASSPSTSLSSKKVAYRVDCKVQAPPDADLSALAESVRQNIERVLEEQSVPYRGSDHQASCFTGIDVAPRTDSAQESGFGLTSLISRIRA